MCIYIMARSKYEIRVQKILQKQGYIVDWKIRPRIVPKTYQVDYFGLFDLVAIRSGDPIRWIAVKGKAGDYHKLRPKIEAFWMPEGNSKELWRFPKGMRYPHKVEFFNEEYYEDG